MNTEKKSSSTVAVAFSFQSSRSFSLFFFLLEFVFPSRRFFLFGFFVLLSTADSLKAIFYAKCKKRDYCKCWSEKNRRTVMKQSCSFNLLLITAACPLSHSPATVRRRRGKMVNIFFYSRFFFENLHFHFGHFGWIVEMEKEIWYKSRRNKLHLRVEFSRFLGIFFFLAQRIHRRSWFNI